MEGSTVIQDRPSATRPLWKVEKTVGTTRFGNITGTPPRAVPAEPVLRGQIYGGAFGSNVQAVAVHGSNLVLVNSVISATVPTTVGGGSNFLPGVIELDVSNVNNTLEVGRVDGHASILASSGCKTFMFGDLLLVALPALDRVSIIDMSDPVNPYVLSSVTHSTNLDDPHFVCAYGNYAYVSCFNALVTIDITNPALPVIANRIVDSTGLRGAGGIRTNATGTHVFVACGTGGAFQLRSYSLSNPAAPSFSNSKTSGASNSASDIYCAMEIEGNNAIVVGNAWLEVWGIGTPSAITNVGQIFPVSNLGTNVSLGYTNIAKINSNFFCSAANVFFTVMNLTTPSAPTTAIQINRTSSNPQYNGVAVVGTRAYAPCPNSNTAVIEVFDVSTPASTSFLRGLHDPGTMSESNFSIDTVNNKAWVISADSSKGHGRCISGYDVSDVDNPFYSGLIYQDFGSLNLSVTQAFGNYVFATGAGGIGTLGFFNSFNASTMALVQAVSPVGGSGDYFVINADGTRAYVQQSGVGGLAVYDISNPAAMTLLGTVTHAFLANARRLAILANGLVAVACLGRLTLVNVSNPASMTVTSLADSNMNGAKGIATSGNVAHCIASSSTTGSIANYDCSSGTPVLTGAYSTTPYLVDAAGVEVRNQYAYVICFGTRRVTVMDVAPGVPALVHSVVYDDHRFYPDNCSLSGDTLTVLSYEAASIFTLSI